MKGKTFLYWVASAALLLMQPVISAQTPADTEAWAGVNWNWTDLGKGARAASAEVKLFESVQCISIVELPGKRFRPILVHAPGEECATTDVLAQRLKGRIALNGSYFNMRRLVPHTFFALKHKVISETSPGGEARSNGVLCIKGRKMEIQPYDSLRREYFRRHFDAAIASGPILLLDGKELAFPNTSFCYMRHPRSFLGWRADGTVCLVVVDGRFPGQGDGMSVPELIALCRLLGLKDAINFDGGGSSTLWTDRTGILNHPYDNHRFDHEGARKVPNALVFR